MQLFKCFFVIAPSLLLVSIANAKMIITKETMRNCGLSTISLDSFKECCFRDAIVYSDTQAEHNNSGETNPQNNNASTNSETENATNDEWAYNGLVENPYVFSNATRYTYEGRSDGDPDTVDWSDELSVFWYYFYSSGPEMAQEKTGMSFSEAFNKQNELNTNGICELNPKKHLWKAVGVTAIKGNQKINIDVIIGEAKCISTNISDNGGTICVCSVKSVSVGSIQKKWVRGDSTVGFYMGDCYNNNAGICENTCAERCAQDFASNDNNVRSLLMNWWKP